jgi:hypothetical protein
VPRKRFLLVIPVFQAVYAKPLANFLAMALSAASTEGDRYELLPHVPERQSLPSLMNKACEIVLEHDFDGLIVADDDCGPPFSAISQLLRRYEAGHPIVLGLGFMRNFPHTTTIGRYYPEGPTLITNGHGGVEWSGFHWIDDVLAEPTEDGLIRVDFGGFPIALISREAIKAITPPWFGLEIDGGACTHDVYFGAKAHRANLPIVVDTHIPCSHLAESPWITFENREVIRRVRQTWTASQTHEPVSA